MTVYNRDAKMNNIDNNCLPEFTEKNGIHYILAGDVYLPLIAGTDYPKKPLGFWGRQRHTFLKEHDSGLYTELLLTGTLFDHLSEIDDAAQRRYDALINAMQASQGITEQLKAEDALGWAEQMNAIAAAVREIVADELIYTSSENPFSC
ncbi:MAG: TnpV protein [Clostridia bacterium]|nr:TnpV protein [Clostridia bacterium]